MKAGSIREPIEQIFIILKRDEAEHGTRMGWRGKKRLTGSNAEKIPDSVKAIKEAIK